MRNALGTHHPLVQYIFEGDGVLEPRKRECKSEFRVQQSLFVRIFNDEHLLVVQS